MLYGLSDEMWDVGNVVCYGSDILRMWDLGDVRYSGCGMWDVGRLPGCGMLIYKCHTKAIRISKVKMKLIRNQQ